MLGFPEDVVVEILCRLPKKSITQFKCVCKEWLTLISDRSRVFPKSTHVGLVCQSYLPPRLRAKGRASSIAQTEFLEVDNEGTARLIACPPLGKSIKNNCLLLSSCDGFLLFRKEKIRKETFEFVVCHPATKRLWNVSRRRNWRWIHVGLASTGSGHHFKLLLLSAHSLSCWRGHPASGAWYMSEIYCSENEEWSVKQWESPDSHVVPHRQRSMLDSGKSVFVNGAFHWIWGRGNKLVVFHIGRKKDCEFIKLPRVGDGRGHVGRMTQCIWLSKGRVNYCRVTARGGHRIGIWRLHSVGRGWWEEKHDGILAPPPRPMVGVEQHPISFVPLAFNEDFEIVYLMCGNAIFSYSLVTKETKEACASPFEGSVDPANCIALPFLYLTRFDVAAAAATPANGDRDKKVKRRKLL